MRRGSLASALSSIENIQKIVPSFARALSHQSSRDHNIVSDNEEDVWLGSYSDSHTLPHSGFVKNASWKSVQGAVISVFQQKPLTVLERTMLCENMRDIGNSEIGPFVHEFYKEHLVKRAMSILLEHIETDNNDCIQEKLMTTWNAFYKEMLPLLQSIFLDISVQMQQPNIKDVTLLAFRDDVLFTLNRHDVLMKSAYVSEYPEALVQMLLVLQHIKDPGGHNEDSHRLEELVAVVVNPYLGHCGLYKGQPYPVFKNSAVVLRRKHIAISREDTKSHSIQRPDTLKLPAIQRVQQESLEISQKRQRTATMSVASSRSTESIPEQLHGKGRRHSVQFDLR